VLLPNDSDNYYHKRDLIPPELASRMGEASFVITNFHAFQKRTLTDISKTGRAVLFGRKKPVEEGIFTESDAQMVRRVLKDLGNKRNVIVINDEAHHCYRRRVEDAEEETEKLKGDERKEAEEREEEARIWISGLEAIQKQRGIKCVYDLSATPFFLKGSGYSEGTPFKWIVSDFSLIDAIESGVVKIPRVPVEDNKMDAEGPTYRDLWLNIRDKLPKKGRKKEALDKHAPPALPAELETAIESLYSNYRKYYKQWEKASGSNSDAGSTYGATPPVFIVVCNNTNVSSEVYRYIAGYERLLPDGSMVHVKGKLDLFNNVEESGNAWLKRPNTILVDSQQLESGDAMSPEFKAAASYEIEEFKNEYRKRFPDRDVEKLTDEDLLREVMNTVGKAGKIGAGIRCVVSVSMLTEGWDANTVTHVLGVRAFGTQLLCEQVVGRGLRRMSYAANEDGMFVPEYAEIYGVPFSFIPTAGSGEPPDPKRTTRVRALKEREHLRITFPRVIGYKYEFPDKKLRAKFVKESRMTLSPKDIPTWTDVEGIVGPAERHDLNKIRSTRVQEVAFHVAKTTLERYFTSQVVDNRVAAGAPMTEPSPVTPAASEFVEASLFPQVLRITKDWMDTQLTCEGEAFPQLLMVSELMRDAASRIHLSIPPPEVNGEPRILPRMADYDAIGSSDYVDFDTAKPTYETRKSHVSHVIADTISWEQKMAQNLEEDPRVIAYVKNDHLGFTIPYDFQGEERQYYPDFIALVREADGSVTNLIVEVSGYNEAEKSFKVATARDKWVPAINNDGRFGRWDFVEVKNPWSEDSSIT
jgi:type III restriction enzyme